MLNFTPADERWYIIDTGDGRPPAVGRRLDNLDPPIGSYIAGPFTNSDDALGVLEGRMRRRNLLGDAGLVAGGFLAGAAAHAILFS